MKFHGSLPRRGWEIFEQPWAGDCKKSAPLLKTLTLTVFLLPFGRKSASAF